MIYLIDMAKLEKFVNETIKEVVKKMVEGIMIEERKAYLEENPDRANGFYERNLIVNNIAVKGVKIPRVRSNNWRSCILGEPYQRNSKIGTSPLDLCCLLCFSGMSSREAAKIIAQITNIKLSHSTIARIIKKGKEVVEEFRKSKLLGEYIAIFLDAKYVKISYPNGIEGGLLVVAIGLNSKGNYEVLDIEVVLTNKESSQCYVDLLKRIKERGVKEVKYVITDGISGIETIIRKFYPNVKYQRCIVHYMRNIEHKVRQKDKGEIIKDFKEMLAQQSPEEAKNYFYNKFYVKWGRVYKRLVEQIAKDLGSIVVHLEVPKEFRRYINTTNVVERFMRRLGEANKRSAFYGGFERIEHLAVYTALQYNNEQHRIPCHRKWENFWTTLDNLENFL